MFNWKYAAIILAVWLTLSQAVTAGLPKSPSPTPAGHVLPQTVRVGEPDQDERRQRDQR